MSKKNSNSIRDAQNRVQEFANNAALTKQLKEWDELCSDTVKWLQILSDGPSNRASAKLFPMTPSDVSRSRKRTKIDTIVESDETDDVIPVQPMEPIRRGSRTAFKLASLKMKEPSLNTKLRRPSSSILEAEETNSTVSVAANPKHSRDSLTSERLQDTADEPMETDDDIVTKTVQSTKISTYNNSTMKSSSRVKTIIETRNSKRITKQCITTVVDSPAKRTRTSRQSVDMFASSDDFDSEDDVPITNFVSKPSKADLNVVKITSADAKSIEKNGKRSGSLTAINGLVPVIKLHDIRLSYDVEESSGSFKIKESSTTAKVINQEPKKDVEIDCKTKKALIVDAPAAKEPPVAKQNKAKPKPFTNATNRNTPEAIKNTVNRNFEPVSVKKRVEALEQKLAVGPMLMAKPDVPVRVTRTKAKAMLVALSSAAPQKMETAHLMKLARKSLLRATKISLAKERKRSVLKENTPPPHATKLPQSSHSTVNKNMAAQQSQIHPTRLLAQMETSKQPLNVNLSAIATFLPKTKVVSAAEEAEEERKEKRRLRRENKDDALLKKKALMEDKIEQQRKKREEKARNVLIQRAHLEQEKAEMISRTEKENEEKARLIHEREENLKKEMLRKKEEAKQKAAKIEERRLKKEEKRLEALKLQEEEQQKLQALKKKEQEDAERVHARRMLEEKERKEKDKEAALKLEKEKQAKKVLPKNVLDTTFVVGPPPALVAHSEDDYPLADVSHGNDSDFSDGDQEAIPKWAQGEELKRTLRIVSDIPLQAMFCYFGSKPLSMDIRDIYPNARRQLPRSSSALWKTPP